MRLRIWELEEWDVLDRNWPVLRTQLPDWSSALLVGVSVALALVVLAALLLPFGRRVGSRASDADPTPAAERPGLDVMLLVSTLTIVGLALAVYLTRP